MVMFKKWHGANRAVEEIERRGMGIVGSGDTLVSLEIIHRFKRTVCLPVNLAYPRSSFPRISLAEFCGEISACPYGFSPFFRTFYTPQTPLKS